MPHKKETLILATGFPWSEDVQTEILNLGEEECTQLPDFPIELREASGALIKEKYPLICGGFDGAQIREDCYLLGSSYEKFTKLLGPRSRHANLVLSDSIWITGGVPNFKSSTEFVHFNGTVERGPELPITVRDHSIEWLNDFQAILIGGSDTNFD